MAEPQTALDNEPTAASRVLDVEELAEKIILELSFVDILKFRRVNRYAAQVIANSIALQQKLHLAPMPGDKEKPQHLLPMLPKHMDYRVITLRLGIYLLNGSDQKALWRAMLLTQPPITRALIRHTCPSLVNFGEVYRDIESEDGIRLGEVDVAAQRVMMDHMSLCGCIVSSKAIAVQVPEAVRELIKEKRL